MTAAVVITGIVAYHDGHDTDSVLLMVASNAVTLCYVTAGVIARHQPGRERLAAPMILAGFTVNLPDLLDGLGAPQWAVFDSVFVFDVFVVIVLLTYPVGRVRTRPERWTVRGAVIVLVPFHMALYPLHTFAVFEVLVVVESALQVMLCVAVSALLIARWRRSSAAVRRVLSPLWVAGVLAAVSFAPLPMLRPLTNLAVQDKLSAATSAAALRVFFDANNVATYVQLLIPVCFLFGLVRASGARAAVADLVLALESAREPGPVRDAIARALGDPTLRVYYWVGDHTPDGVDDSPRLVSADGAPLERAPIGAAQASTDVTGAGGPLATFVHDRELLAQPALLRAVVATARLSLDNTRLQAQLHAQLAQVRQSRARIVTAGLQERRRVERDLHDGAQQRMLALGLTVSMLRDRLADNPSPDQQLSRLADQAAGEVRESITELRELARGIHPAVLTSQGLHAATTALTHRCPVPVSIDIAARQRWSPETEATAYFVISEALTNITKHAHARAATVGVHETHGRLHVEICDNGIGGLTTQWQPGIDPGSGLAGLADRVAALGGVLQVRSAPGHGTTVKAELPCS